jgi:hypothetical protein
MGSKTARFSRRVWLIRLRKLGIWGCYRVFIPFGIPVIVFSIASDVFGQPVALYQVMNTFLMTFSLLSLADEKSGIGQVILTLWASIGAVLLACSLVPGVDRVALVRWGAVGLGGVVIVCLVAQVLRIWGTAYLSSAELSEALGSDGPPIPEPGDRSDGHRLEVYYRIDVVRKQLEASD